jgi:predicted GNAT family N-acyltransferase
MKTFKQFVAYLAESRTIEFTHHNSRAKLIDNGSHFTLTGVHTPESDRGKGHASEVIKKALAHADSVKKPVRLTHVAIDDGMTSEGLHRLYSKHGFTSTDKKFEMERKIH